MASEKKVPVKRETEYVVLEGYEDQWAVMLNNDGTTIFKAANAVAAMKQGAALTDVRRPAHEASETLFSAVPARSWKPMRRNVEQVTKETWTS